MQMKNIKIEPHYGTQVVVLPVPADPARLRDATREQLAVLIALMTERSFSYFTIAEKSGATREQIDNALQYWQDAGVLTLMEAEAQGEPSTAPAPAPREPAHQERAAELPHYNTEEAARFLEHNPSATSLIDCCQQELGKIFNTSEAEIIIGLLDYLSLEPDYILLLCAHCAKKSRRSLRYIEKMAITLHDAGIVTYEQLELHLKKTDMADSAESALREMFGIGKRALLKRERECFSRWIAEWEMPLDVIEHAYEITVSRTHEPSVPYANAILEKWHADGLRTLADVQAAEDARRAQNPSVPASGSFDTDDFFEAALKRSYGESYTDDIFESERKRSQGKS